MSAVAATPLLGFGPDCLLIDDCQRGNQLDIAFSVIEKAHDFPRQALRVRIGPR
jgi:hypothetical protein